MKSVCAVTGITVGAEGRWQGGLGFAVALSDGEAGHRQQTAALKRSWLRTRPGRPRQASGRASCHPPDNPKDARLSHFPEMLQCNMRKCLLPLREARYFLLVEPLLFGQNHPKQARAGGEYGGSVSHNLLWVRHAEAVAARREQGIFEKVA
ncbi:hypothetical protein GCM10027396_17960 [Insolitispirillum peregrinum]